MRPNWVVLSAVPRIFTHSGLQRSGLSGHSMTRPRQAAGRAAEGEGNEGGCERGDESAVVTAAGAGLKSWQVVGRQEVLMQAGWPSAHACRAGWLV